MKYEKARKKIQSVTVIEQENENDENEIRPKGDVRLEEMIKGENKERNKKKGLNKKQGRRKNKNKIIGKVQEYRRYLDVYNVYSTKQFK